MRNYPRLENAQRRHGMASCLSHAAPTQRDYVPPGHHVWSVDNNNLNDMKMLTGVILPWSSSSFITESPESLQYIRHGRHGQLKATHA